MKFRHSGDSQNGAINPSNDEDFPNDEKIEQLRVLSNTTDLAVTIAGPPDPVSVGDTTTVTVTTKNVGTIPASEPTVELNMPAGMSLASAPDYCTGTPVKCTLPLLASGATDAIGLQLVAIDAGDQTATATVANGAGPESNAADNTAWVVVHAVNVNEAPVAMDVQVATAFEAPGPSTHSPTTAILTEARSHWNPSQRPPPARRCRAMMER